MRPEPPTREQLRDAVARALGRPDLELLAIEPLSGALHGHSPNWIHRVQVRNGACSDLILRIYRGAWAEERFRVERAVHVALAERGFPLPRWHAGTARDETLAAPLAVLDRLPGWNGVAAMSACIASGFALGSLGLRGAGLLAIAVSGAVTGRLQARLHRLPLAPLRDALRGEAARLDLTSFRLEELAKQIDELGLTGLAPGLAWLEARRPPASTASVLCHGDLHPGNVLVSRRGALGLIDWEGVGIAPPEYDLASTRTRITLQSGLSIALPRPLLVAADTLLWLLLSAVYACHQLAYRASLPLDAGRLRYFAALEALRLLTLIARARAVQRGEVPPAGWELAAPPHIERRILRRFRRATGVDVRLPAPV